MRKSIIPIVIGCLSAFMMACQKIDSDLVQPREIEFRSSIDFFMKGESISTTVVVCSTKTYHETSTDPQIVDLIDGDKLTCNGVRMRRKDNTFGFSYEAMVPVAQDNNYTIAFYSKGAYYDSVTIKMPEPFEILNLKDNFEINYNDPINVSTDSQFLVDVKMIAELKATFNNINSRAEVIGSNTLQLPSLKEANSKSPILTGSSEAQLSVQRYRYKEFSGNFNGSIYASRNVLLKGKVINPQNQGSK